MILNSVGNKKLLAERIIKTFPKHSVYLEPFFRTGSIYFLKKRVLHNYINDINDDVFNLWFVYTNHWQELYDKILELPKSESLFKHWLENKESDKVMKALRFLYLSNYSYMNTGGSLYFSGTNPKRKLLENYNKFTGFLDNVSILCSDFRKFFKSIAINYKQDNFVAVAYLDPPYLGRKDVYNLNDKTMWSEKDVTDLFDIVCNEAKKFPEQFYFAYSEFNHPFILEQAKERGLHVLEIGERRNLKTRDVEILVTNYVSEFTENNWFE